MMSQRMTSKAAVGCFLLALLVVCATAENTWSRRALLQGETMPAMNMTGSTNGNVTGNATSGDNRSRRGNGGGGTGNRARPQAQVCRSINCNRRKLLQPTETSTTPPADLATTDGLASAPNVTMGAMNTTGMEAMNATMVGLNATMAGLNATNATGNATDDRSRRRHSCSEGSCAAREPRYGEFGV